MTMARHRKIGREAQDLMFDPTLLLSPQSFDPLKRLSSRPSEDRLFVPATFMAVIADMALYPDVARYFGPPPVPLREGEEIELESTEPPTGPAITYSELGEWLRGTGVVPYEPSEADLDNATE